MEPPSTVDNSLTWRLWHSINYFIGGSTFFVGSLVLFPFFMNIMDNATVSAWLYTIGSAAFLLADLTQWSHYLTKDCDYLVFAINFLFSVFGSACYLVGSACFIPALNATPTGELLFVIGSAIIVVSQIWKLYRAFSQKDKTVGEVYHQDKSGFYVDLFAGLGALMYFIGTFVLQKSETDSSYLVLSVIIYVLGGTFFTLSGVAMQIRYFCFSGRHESQNSQANYKLNTSEL